MFQLISRAGARVPATHALTSVAASRAISANRGRELRFRTAGLSVKAIRAQLRTSRCSPAPAAFALAVQGDCFALSDGLQVAHHDPPFPNITQARPDNRILYAAMLIFHLGAVHVCVRRTATPKQWAWVDVRFSGVVRAEKLPRGFVLRDQGALLFQTVSPVLRVEVRATIEEQHDLIVVRIPGYFRSLFFLIRTETQTPAG